MDQEAALQAAARAIAQATALVITAGAGMGVDSGLPDFRGNQGFWNAYPPYRHLGLSFIDMANPRWFVQDPALAWGFYGHRLMLYRATVPHSGFALLRQWAETMRDGFRVFTSNVDGQFQKAGFDESCIEECHGSIHHLQCTSDCGIGIFDAAPFDVDVDQQTFRARDPLPACPRCGALARPNVLMFGDWQWDASRSALQEQAFSRWAAHALTRPDGRLVVVECGAGLAIPTVRRFGESLVARHHGTLVRINMREPAVPEGHVGLAMGAGDALGEIDRRLRAT